MVKFVKFLLTLNAFLLLSACGGDNSGLPKSDCGGDNNPCDPYPVALVITPDNVTVPTEVDINYTAMVTLSDGSTHDVTGSASWQIAENSIATITASGIATTVSVGATTVSASYSASNGVTVSDDTALTVNDADLIGLDVTPLQHQTLVGLTTEYRAYARYQSGQRFDVTQSTNWQIEDAELAELRANDSDSISVVAKQTGITDVKAVFKSLENQGQLAIIDSPVSSLVITPIDKQLPLGTQAQYQANLILENGQSIDVTLQSSWKIEDDTIGQFNKTQVFNAASVGSTSISAAFTYEDINLTDSTSVTVTNAVAERLLITPQDGVFPLGTQGQYKAEALYSDGHVEDVTLSSVWQLADDIGSISPNGNDAGYAIATSVGKSTVSAQFANLSANTSVEVTNAELVELTLTPINYVTPSGTHVSYSGYARFTDESVQNVTQLGVWSSSEQEIANIGFTGARSGIAKTYTPGVTQICINYLNKQACTSLTVTAAVSEKLVITPVDAQVPLGTEGQYTATAHYTDGHTADVTNIATWQISDTNIATIETSGLNGGYTISKSVGQTNVSASFESLTDSTSLTITDAELVNLVISPSNSTIAKGNSQSYEVIGQYTDGSFKDLTNQATWQSSDNNIAYISSPSIAFGANTGSVNIIATVQGQQVTAKLTVTSAEITHIEVMPTSLSIAKGHRGQLTATAYYTDSTSADITQIATWKSLDGSIAAVTASGASGGLAYGLEQGQTTVTATYSGMKDDALITVTEAVLEQVVIEPKVATVAAGVNQIYTLRAIYSDGTSNNVTSSASWISSASAVATIDAAGVATTYTAGQTNITGQYQGMNDSGVLTVTQAVITELQVTPVNIKKPKGSQGQYTAKAIYSDKTIKDVTTQALWQSADASIVSIETGSINPGLAFGENVGTTEISAQFDGQTGKTNATVTDAELVTLVISPQVASIPVGTTQQFNLQGIYTDSSTRDLTAQATWQSSDNTIASISNAGLARGNLQGSVTISANVKGKTATATLKVNESVITHLEVTPKANIIAKGTSTQLKATAYYTDLSSKDVTSLATWISDDSSVASVGNITTGGFVTGNDKGNTIIEVSFDGMTDTSAVEVINAKLVNVVITPKTTSIPIGLTTQFELVAHYTDATQISVTLSSDWSATTSTIASIDNKGLAKANSKGITQITGTFEGMSDSAEITVTDAAITKLQVTPATVSVPLGTQGQFDAQAFYSDGHSETVTSLAVWQSNDSSIANVDSIGANAGFAWTQAVGTTQISASYDGMIGTAEVTVTDAELVSINISPVTKTTYVGGQVQYQAFGIYTDASNKELTKFATWFSDDTSIASIDAAGVATGNSAGDVIITASYDSITSNDADLTVGPAIIERLVVYPTPQETPAGSEIQFKAHAYFSDSSNFDVTKLVNWQSLEQSIAVHNGNGLFATLVEGATAVQADYQGLTSTGELIVTAAVIDSLTISPVSAELNVSETKQFKTFVNYSNGTSFEVTNSSNWQISDTSIATVSTSGLVTANQQGNTQVQAEYSGKIALADITVTGKAIDRISVTPFLKQINEGETFNFQAQAIHPDGSFTNVTTLATWKSDNTGVATVITSGAEGGLATGKNDGVARISATYAGLTGNGQLTVLALPPQLTGIVIEPANVNVYVNGSRQLSAYAIYDNNFTNLIDVTNTSDWTIDDDSLAFISTPGLVNGTLIGTTQVNATFQGQTGSTQLNVFDDPVEYLEISPNDPEVPIETIGRFKVIAAYVSGHIEDVTTQATWTSSDTSVVSIVPTGADGGTASAIAVGTSKIKATFKGEFDTTVATVTGPTLSNVYIDRTSFSVHVSADGKSEVKAKAYADFSDGNTLDVTQDGQWRMADESIAFVNPQGPNIFVVGVSPGNTELLFNYAGMSDTADVEVYASQLKEIIVSPANEVFPESQTIQYTAKGVYANGTELDITESVNWTIEDDSIATVNESNGKVTTKQRGVTNVIASSNGISGKAKLTVSEFSLYYMEVNPEPINMRVGQSQQLACYAVYVLIDDTSVQQRIDVTTQADWQLRFSSDIVELSSSGYISAKSTGTNQVECRLDNGNGSFTVHEVDLTVTY
ncbi:Ig-like domain-containing protein [Pseudoalteromonas spongiae]|uniref:Ig-like domain-containing protein n=1 Tax=Pseudoalteromonas spongiae TaxID=298657 RepID=UPI00110B799E|nr:Ig-like domain-containing protein [Pseudoalteromonas spongiae]TMO84617.1 hypothetical protein CWC15_10030 [Pseudoalteromonas spongiae]